MMTNHVCEEYCQGCWEEISFCCCSVAALEAYLDELESEEESS